MLICNIDTPSKAARPQKSIETLSQTNVKSVTAENRVSPPKRKARSSTRYNRCSKMAKHKSRNETETDSSEDPVRSPPKRLRRQLPFSHSTDDTTDELTQTTRHSPSKANRKAAQPIPIKTTRSIITDDSSDVVVTPRRRLRKRTDHAPTIGSKDSEEQAADLREDLEDLRESGGLYNFLLIQFPHPATAGLFPLTNVEIRKTRTRGSKSTQRKSEKQKQLEILRRHHAREKPTDLSSDNQAPSSISHLADETSEDEDIDSGTEASGTEAVRRSLFANPDEYDEDFVDDEDEDGTLGAPHGLKDIPLEFTSYASKKPIEYFKIAVEWMVHNKLNPAFARDDMLYRIAVRKLDDEVQGFTGSKFVSSVWRDEFTKALKSRPHMSIDEGPFNLEHNCEACRRGGHPATYKVKFAGKPYNRVTLEDISDDDDDEDEDAMSTEGQEFQTFHLGR